MLVLSQFIFRLSFGLALAMMFVGARHVTSGYFRNNLYVLLGLNFLATVVAWLAGSGSGLSLNSASGHSLNSGSGLSLWPPLAATVLCYLGAAAWLYEAPRAGKLLLLLAAATSLVAGWLALPRDDLLLFFRMLEFVVSGCVLGWTLAAMLLGHWYLNSPGMKLFPLRTLIVGTGWALASRTMLSAMETAPLWNADVLNPWIAMVLAWRWLAGLVGAGVAAWMAWRTLQIPNTQSATGILYVAVMLVFSGELAALLLSEQAVGIL